MDKQGWEVGRGGGGGGGGGAVLAVLVLGGKGRERYYIERAVELWRGADVGLGHAGVALTRKNCVFYAKKE